MRLILSRLPQVGQPDLQEEWLGSQLRLCNVIVRSKWLHQLSCRYLDTPGHSPFFTFPLGIELSNALIAWSDTVSGLGHSQADYVCLGKPAVVGGNAILGCNKTQVGQTRSGGLRGPGIEGVDLTESSRRGYVSVSALFCR